MSFALADLNFGKDDAETDITSGLLRAGFLETYAYEQARAARKTLIIGRKGSGKSAICRTLAAGPDPTSLVTPDELSSKQVREFSLDGIAPDMAKALMWRYILAVRVGLHLVEHAKTHAKTPKSVGLLTQFLKDNGELQKGNSSKFSEILARLKTSLKLDAFGVSVTVEMATKPEGIRTADQVEMVEDHIKKAIADLDCLPAHPPLLLLVDQIEDVWQTSDAGLSDTLVIGLLKAAKYVMATYRGVACVVFLRSDIYDLLSFVDKDKFHGEELRLGWSADQLRELALKRARASLGEGLKESVLWTELFLPYDDGHVSDVLLRHTLLRPRDIIHLCNLCTDTALFHGHTRIEPADVNAALGVYSKWKLADLTTEYALGYPYLGSVLPAFEDHGYIVTRTGLAQMLPPDALEALRQDYPRRAHELTYEGVLDTLYDIGFLGVRHNGKVTYTKGEGDHVKPVHAEFHIHPCFRLALNATNAAISTHYRSTNDLRRLAQLRGRDSRESQVVLSASRMIDTLMREVSEAGLPTDVTREVQRSLSHILNGLPTDGRPPGAAVTDHLLGVQNYLYLLGEQLRDGGFTAKGEGLDQRFSNTAQRITFHRLASGMNAAATNIGREASGSAAAGQSGNSGS